MLFSLTTFAFAQTNVETRLALNSRLIDMLENKEKELEKANITKGKKGAEMETFFGHLIDGLLMQPTRYTHKKWAWENERNKYKTYFLEGYENFIERLKKRRSFLEEYSSEEKIKKKIIELKELLE